MKKQFRPMIGLGLIGLLLLAALLLLVQKPEPGLSEVRNLLEQIQMVRDYGVDAEAYSAEHASQTVLTVGDMTLSNERFNYSFWSCYNAYVNSLDGALPFEETQPLSSQKRENGITWEQYFVQQALEEARRFFRPELLGRMDETVVFEPLGADSLEAIADRLLCQLEERAGRSGYRLHHTPQVARALAGQAKPGYGARELRRQVSRAVEQALADRIAAGQAVPGSSFTAQVGESGIELRADQPALV